MNIIIPSKNIYKVDNPKILKNKINAVNYSYDNMVSETKEISFNYDIWNNEIGFNGKLKTIHYGNKVFIETEIVIEDFSVDILNIYSSYPNLEWIGSDGQTNYGLSIRNDSRYYKIIDRKLHENDEILSQDLRFLVYKDTVSRGKTILTCYIFAGLSSGTYAGYNTSASIYVSYATFAVKDVSIDNNGQFALQKNELMQSGTLIDGNYVIYEYISNQIISEYKNGKETATIRCSVSDYFYENGEKVIDIKGEKMSFDIGNEVIPMVFGADGVDRPMSRYKDGTPKVFKVVGMKFIYDGAVWQELTLQEKTKKA